jgi:hypothetical protein
MVSVKDPPHPLDKTPRELKIKETRTFTKIELKDLTPWLGTCSPSPGKEVYP